MSLPCFPFGWEFAARFWRNLAFELKHRLDRANERVEHYVDLSQVLRENPTYADLLGGIYIPGIRRAGGQCICLEEHRSCRLRLWR